MKFNDLGLPDYRDKVERICSEYISGHKVVARSRLWDFNKKLYKSGNYERCASTANCGSFAWLERSIVSDFNDKNPQQYGQYIDRDVCYNIWENDDRKTFKVNMFSTEWEGPSEFTSTFRIFYATRQIYLPRDDERVISSNREDFEGRPAIKLVLQDKNDIETTLFLDSDTYRFLYSETNKSPDVGTRQLVDDRQIAKMTYRDSDGKQLPFKYEMYKLTSDGKRYNMFEIDFIEYVPYTPTADELDLEKQFGIKPIPHEPRPASAMPPTGGGRAVWLYAAAGVLAAVAAGLVAWSRRRRIAT